MVKDSLPKTENRARMSTLLAAYEAMQPILKLEKKKTHNAALFSFFRLEHLLS